MDNEIRFIILLHGEVGFRKELSYAELHEADRIIERTDDGAWAVTKDRFGPRYQRFASESGAYTFIAPKS